MVNKLLVYQLLLLQRYKINSQQNQPINKRSQIIIQVLTMRPTLTLKTPKPTQLRNKTKIMMV